MSDAPPPVEVDRYLEMIARRKDLILVFCVSATLTSLALTYVFSEKYRASTTILYQPSETVSFSPKVQEALGFPPPLVPLESIGNTLDEVARSDGVLEQVVRTLRLDQKRKRPASNIFVAAFRDTKDWVKQRGAEAWQVLKYGRVLPRDPFVQAMSDLRSNLSIERTSKAYTFQLEVLDSDPRLAAAIVDTTAKVLGDVLSTESMRAARATKQRIEARLRQNEQEAAELRASLEGFKRQAEISSLGEEISLKLRGVADFEEEHARVGNDLRAAEKRRDELVAQLKSQDRSVKYMSTTEDNPVVKQMRLELAQLQVERSGLLEKLTEKHPDVKAVDAKIAEVQEKLQREVQRVVSSESTRINDVYQKLLSDRLAADAEILSLQAKEKALSAALEREREAVGRLTAREPALGALTLQIEAAGRSHQLINEAYEEARLAEFRAASGVAVLHPALVPTAPARPIKIVHVGVSAALSLALAVGAVFFVGFFDSSLKRVEQVERVLDLPVLATIPAVRLGEGGDDRLFPRRPS
jgi:succinoglycan biosynthesis transport protein ExoP